MFDKVLELELFSLFLQATVGFTLFGKETLADLDIKEIVAEVD